MMNYALRYLFDTTKLFDHRYQILRYAVFCFVLSTVSLFVAIAIMIFKILNLLNC
jgi:hypothetical protein